MAGRAGFLDRREQSRARAWEWHSGPQVRDDWRRLFERCPGADISLHPDVALAAASPPPAVVARRDRDAFDAALVLARRRVRLAAGPGSQILSLRGVQVVGEQLLCDGGDGADLLADEATALLRSGAADCLLFEDVEVGSPLWERLHTLGDAEARVYHPRPPQAHWRIRFADRGGDPDLYWRSQFSGRSRQTLRRKLRRFEHNVVRYTRRGDVGALLRQANQVSRQSWQSRRLGLRIRNDDAERRRLEALADHDALRAYVLEHAGRPAAFLMGVQSRDRFLYDEVGFDSALRGGSPGTVLLVRTIEDLLRDRTPAVLDFGTGDGVHKRQFGNVRTESGPVVVVAPGLWPSLMLQLGRAHRRLDQGARSILHRTGLYEAARSLYRR